MFTFEPVQAEMLDNPPVVLFGVDLMSESILRLSGIVGDDSNDSFP